MAGVYGSKFCFSVARLVLAHARRHHIFPVPQDTAARHVVGRPAYSKRSLPASGAVSEWASTSGKRPRLSARTSTASRAGSSLTSGSSGAPSRGSAQKIEDRLQRLTRPLVVQRGLAPRLRGLVSSSAAPVTPLAFKTEKAELGAGGKWQGLWPPDAKGGRLCDVGLLRVAERRAGATPAGLADAYVKSPSLPEVQDRGRLGAYLL